MKCNGTLNTFFQKNSRALHRGAAAEIIVEAQCEGADATASDSGAADDEAERIGALERLRAALAAPVLRREAVVEARWKHLNDVDAG